jgi:hypothetical protein
MNFKGTGSLNKIFNASMICNDFSQLLAKGKMTINLEDFLLLKTSPTHFRGKARRTNPTNFKYG